MEFLSKRIACLSESQTMAMNQKSKDLQEQGIDIINLSVGEPDFFTPSHIKQAAKQAVDDNFSFYSPAEGYMDLRRAVAGKFQRENGLHYTAQQIIVSNGAKHALANAILSLVDEGDEVIVPAPYWVTYVELVKLAGGTNVVIRTLPQNGYKVTPQELAQAITPKTKALLLCSPSNPTGSVYSRDELKALADIIVQHPRMFVIADEIYEHINFVGGHESIAQFEGMYEKTVVINGVSKAYAMTGYRIGYLAAPLWIARACAKLQGQFTSGPSSIAQRAAYACLTMDASFTSEMNVAFRRRRDLVMEGLSKIKGMSFVKPDGAFYVFPDVTSFFGKTDGERMIQNATDVSLYLLDKAHVSTVPGEGFGEPNGIRISYATSDQDLCRAMEAIKAAMDALH